MVELESSNTEHELNVEVTDSTSVPPMADTPRHTLWLSDLDLLTLQSYTPTVYYYRTTGAAGTFSPAAMKDALSRVLVPFYPLAGRLVVGAEGRLEIDCCGDGALFVVARSGNTLDELGEVVPSEKARRLLVPAPDSGEPPCALALFQVTFFKCGGVCLGTALHHAAVDGAAGIHFINSWADAARGLPLAVPPFTDRTVLRHRPVLNPAAAASPHLTPPAAGGGGGGSPSFSTAVLKLSKLQVESLKESGRGAPPLSTFKAVASHVWHCACRARGLSVDQRTRLYMPVDIRGRLSPPLPAGYLGNAFFRVSAEAAAGDIMGAGGVEVGADKIQAALTEARPSAPEAAARRPGEEWEMKRSEVWVASWLSMPIFDLDFGWGPPAFMVRASVQFAGLVYLMRSASGDGGVTLAVGFEYENMARFKKLLLNSASCF